VVKVIANSLKLRPVASTVGGWRIVDLFNAEGLSEATPPGR
jgi:hypothetical protein